MKKSTKYLLLIFVLSMIILLNNNTLQAQSDMFFNGGLTERSTEDIGYASRPDDYIFAYSLFEENGFTFNGFGNGNDDDGFTFNDFEFSPDNAPLGNGLLLLSCAGLFYARTKRNRKENNKK